MSATDRADAFVELAATSNFSFLRGASHPEELVATAAALGSPAIGLCDRNTLAGVVRAHLAAREVGIRAIVGCRLAFRDGTPDILAWPVDRAAYGRLCRLLTTGNMRGEKGDCRLDLADLAAWCEGLVLAPVAESGTAETIAATAHALSPRVTEPMRLALNRPLGAGDRRALVAGMQLAETLGIRPLATNLPAFHAYGRRALQDVLTAIREHTTVERAGRLLAVNAERHMKSQAEMVRLFAEFPDVVRESARVALQICFSLDELRYEYPEEPADPGGSPQETLERLTREGARRRYPNGVPDHVEKAIAHELAIIRDLDYAPYFLTVHDIVRFARSKGILAQGRGSAANSAICFCLGITEVDPERGDLLFERFVSPERREPPDIDVDFEHERREEVIQYVYEKYGRERAGLAATVITYRSRSAAREVGKALGLSEDAVSVLAGTIWGWSSSGIARKDVERAGLDPADPRISHLLRLASEIAGFPRHLSQHVGGFVITRGRLDELVPITKAAMDGRTTIEWDKDDIDALGILKIDVLALGMLTCLRKGLDLLARHYGESTTVEAPPARSLEAVTAAPANLAVAPSDAQGGPAIRGGGDEGGTLDAPGAPIPDRGAAPMPDGRPHGAFSGEAPSAPVPLTLSEIPAEDDDVYDMICRADTLGVFQIESRAQMTMLPRLRPRTFYDLVIEVAIVRPGPIQGDMVHPYLRRRQGREAVTYPSEELKAVLSKTLGVPLFQEQAMRIAIVAAGFTPAEADRLRRAMATFKKVGTIGTFQRKMIDGMVAKGYDPEFAERCFRQIEGFGEYGFPESHAASFALLVYASCWLKCHYPDVFCTALLNSQPMGFYAPAQIVRDARRHGVEVRPVDVNLSDWDCTLEEGPPASARLHPDHRSMERAIRSRHAVRLGLRQVKGLSEADMARLVERRGTGYDTVRDVWLRTGLPRATIERLADADAFGSLGLSRRDALWAARALDREGRPEDLPLFAAAGGDLRREEEARLPPMPPGEEVINDYRFLSLSLKAHPAAFVRQILAREGIARAETLGPAKSGQRMATAGLVLVRQRPGSARGVIFMTIEDETGIANVIVWPKVFEAHRQVVLGARFIAVVGRVQSQDGVVHLVAERLEDRTALLARLSDGVGTWDTLDRADEVRRPGIDLRTEVKTRTRLARLLRERPELAGDVDDLLATNAALGRSLADHRAAAAAIARPDGRGAGAGGQAARPAPHVAWGAARSSGADLPHLDEPLRHAASQARKALPKGRNFH